MDFIIIDLDYTLIITYVHKIWVKIEFFSPLLLQAQVPPGSQ